MTGNLITHHVANTTLDRPRARRSGWRRAWIFIFNFIAMALFLSVIPLGFVLLMRLAVKL